MLNANSNVNLSMTYKTMSEQARYQGNFTSKDIENNLFFEDQFKSWASVLARKTEMSGSGVASVGLQGVHCTVQLCFALYLKYILQCRQIQFSIWTNTC